MKVKDHEIVQRFASGDFRLALLCGPDVSRQQMLMGELVATLEADVERVELTAADCADAPARLADEAASASLFGTPRAITLRLASGEAVRVAKALEGLLEAKRAGDPVIVAAAGMAEKTALAKRIAKAPDALIAACYEPSERDAMTRIVAMAREQGLDMPREAVAELARMTGKDMMLAANEIEKIALYLDAVPGDVKPVDPDVLARLGAANDEEDLSALIEHALGGNTDALGRELAALGRRGLSEIGLVRIMLMHLTKLAELRVKIDRGGNIRSVVDHPSVFWKSRAAFARQLGLWNAATIARLIARLLALETALKSSGQPTGVLVEQELLTIARKAARGR